MKTIKLIIEPIKTEQQKGKKKKKGEKKNTSINTRSYMYISSFRQFRAFKTILIYERCLNESKRHGILKIKAVKIILKYELCSNKSKHD